MIFFWLYRKFRARRAARQAQAASTDDGDRRQVSHRAAAASPAQGRSGTATVIGMALHQFRFDLRAFLRNGQSRFFTLALPVLFLVILASLFGGSNHTVAVPHGRISTSVSYVPGIITLGIIAAAFVNLVVSLTAQRESGVLKRRRATPVPASAIIAGRDRKSVV